MIAKPARPSDGRPKTVELVAPRWAVGPLGHSDVSGGKITGIRLWIGATNSLGTVVKIPYVSGVVSSAGSQMPAKANGSSSFNVNRCGSFNLPWVCHS